MGVGRVVRIRYICKYLLTCLATIVLDCNRVVHALHEPFHALKNDGRRDERALAWTENSDHVLPSFKLEEKQTV
ncbi:hypothetical protein BOTBODRAFT_236729 [Botryobasidium botryosum FD-172 SS1]|uniref:Uncharacterized protein n=1 Tax=Botryobasidium botryosum (strain FD-172 SS1) TaxID=930990 RepID=A0A067MLJ6_BOTB1|nr:hypothetical protein BOTBODRAFT_236729 [Botryobasidium botryosum FD-172 SS1]